LFVLNDVIFVLIGNPMISLATITQQRD